MKLNAITITNFVGARAVQIRTDRSVTIVAGRNGAGKTSTRDGFALALTGDLRRVSLKKEVAQLISDGCESAEIDVDIDGVVHSATITKGGKLVGANGLAQSPALPFMPYVLDAQSFAHLDVKERAKFLFGLMGITMEPKAIRARLIDRLYPKGCNGDELNRIDRVGPMLRAGFEAASKDSHEKATAAKGAWRAVTGEAYGSVKAVTWRAVAPAFDQAAMDAAQAELQSTEAAIGADQQHVGELTAAKRAHDERLLKRGELEATASKLERIKTKLASDEKELAEAEQRLASAVAAAGAGPRVGLVHGLAAALSGMLAKASKQNWNDAYPEQYRTGCEMLANYEHEYGKLGTAGDSEAAGRIPGITAGRDLYTRAVANDKRDLTNAEKAAEELRAIAASTWSAGPLGAAQDGLVTLQASQKTLREQLDALRTAKAAAEGATKKTKDAAAHHADVAAWDAIGDALSPTGIPADLLAEALLPINARLEQSALDAEWLRVEIHPDMQITGGLRTYALLSESEQYRVDAMIAEAVSNLSGTKLLVLDRFDVLDLPGRQNLLAWLHVLAEQREIDSALIFGTLKSLPTGLASTTAAHWIENGVVGQLQAAA